MRPVQHQRDFPPSPANIPYVEPSRPADVFERRSDIPVPDLQAVLPQNVDRRKDDRTVLCLIAAQERQLHRYFAIFAAEQDTLAAGMPVRPFAPEPEIPSDLKQPGMHFVRWRTPSTVRDRKADIWSRDTLSEGE
jgi:hypothetical protein